MAAECFGVGDALVEDQGVDRRQAPAPDRDNSEQEDRYQTTQQAPNHILNLLLPAPIR